jgi:aryl-alcohol dehydrogenase-like predicted oxidoreductase
VSLRLRTSRVGLGVWPDAPAGVERDRAGSLERLLWHAAGIGVDWVDTANVYDGAVGEEALGRCIAAMPDDARPALMTKGGIVAGGVGAFPRAAAVLRPSVLCTQLDESLRRLCHDAVDTYLLHHPDETGVPVEESWGEVAALAEEGKTVRCGLCAFSLDQLRRCEAMRHVDVYLARLNPVDLEVSRPLLEWCETHGTDVVAWTGSDVGRLFDPSYAGPLARTPYDQVRQRLERLAAADLAAEMMATSVLRDVARRTGLQLEAVAAAWILAQPGVVALDVGASRGAHLDRWVSGGTADLSADDVELITQAAGGGGVLPRTRYSAPAPLAD